MSLLSEFRTSTPWTLSCGCTDDHMICTCGVAAGHGGVDATSTTLHKTTCDIHPTATLTR